MKRYLVTGGCGFIGSHLADALLARGAVVRILDDLSSGNLRNRPATAELVVGDVGDPCTVEKVIADVDGCFHLAAIASVERATSDWLGTHRTNLGGTIAILDAARRTNPARPPFVVYASSAAVYGDAPGIPHSEATPPTPLSAYGADKLGCELHARVAAAVYNVPSIGLRFFNVYGPRQDPFSPYSGVISQFSTRLLSCLPITIYGDGGQSRDFVYVADVVDALVAAMTRCQEGSAVFNVCTARPTSIIELAHRLAGLTGTSARIDFKPPRKSDIRTSLGDPSLASDALGFLARTDLPTGLARLIKALQASAAVPEERPAFRVARAAAVPHESPLCAAPLTAASGPGAAAVDAPIAEGSGDPARAAGA